MPTITKPAVTTKSAATGKQTTIKKTTRKRNSGAKAKTSRKTAATRVSKPRRERIFALDIGTRSVIGIVAEKEADGLKIIATERQEHKTRAMLDGQIHDVPQVAEVITGVKQALAKRTGPLQHAAVAAAGRALYTMTAEAEMEMMPMRLREIAQIVRGTIEAAGGDRPRGGVAGVCVGRGHDLGGAGAGQRGPVGAAGEAADAVGVDQREPAVGGGAGEVGQQGTVQDGGVHAPCLPDLPKGCQALGSATTPTNSGVAVARCTSA